MFSIAFGTMSIRSPANVKRPTNKNIRIIIEKNIGLFKFIKLFLKLSYFDDTLNLLAIGAMADFLYIADLRGIIAVLLKK
tara:strand:- start:452 stop:691 length:240 start_codon:yes stop_codon:yes gene_type:complete